MAHGPRHIVRAVVSDAGRRRVRRLAVGRPSGRLAELERDAIEKGRRVIHEKRAGDVSGDNSNDCSMTPLRSQTRQAFIVRRRLTRSLTSWARSLGGERRDTVPIPQQSLHRSSPPALVRAMAVVLHEQATPPMPTVSPPIPAASRASETKLTSDGETI